jgi:hypothetical protein
MACKTSDVRFAGAAEALRAAWHQHPTRADWLGVGSRDPSAVEVAAPAPPVRLGPELSLKLHQAPDPGAVGADVRLDLGGQLADGGEVDAE